MLDLQEEAAVVNGGPIRDDRRTRGKPEIPNFQVAHDQRTAITMRLRPVISVVARETVVDENQERVATRIRPRERPEIVL